MLTHARVQSVIAAADSIAGFACLLKAGKAKAVKRPG
jgi:hypothetical protein